MDKGLPTIQRVLELAKQVLQQVPQELDVYYNENFGTDLKGERAKQANSTNRLRYYKGNLSRALQKDGAGNITSVDVMGGQIIVTSGIDDSVIPYARIHEYGGKAGRNGAVTLRPRPYLNPGMESFVQKAFPRYIKRLIKLLGGK